MIEDFFNTYIHKNLHKSKEIRPLIIGNIQQDFIEAKNRIKGIVEEVSEAAPEDVAARTVKNANEINNAYAKDSSDKTFFDVVLPNMQDLLTSITNRKFRENPEFGEQGITTQDFINDLTYGTERNQASGHYLDRGG